MKPNTSGYDQEKILGQLGSSLIEVLVAASILGFIALGTMRIMEIMNKGQKNLHQQFTITQLQNDIARTLMDKDSCRQTLQGLNVGTASGTTRNLNSYAAYRDIVQYVDGATPPERVITTINQEHNLGTGGTIRHDGSVLTLGTVIGPVGTNVQQSATLNLTFARVGEAYGAQILAKTFNLRLVRNAGGVVQDCFSEDDNFLENSCKMLGGRVNGSFCTNLSIYNTPPPPPHTYPLNGAYALYVDTNSFINESLVLRPVAQQSSAATSLLVNGPSRLISTSITPTLIQSPTIQIVGNTNIDGNLTLDSGHWIAMLSDKRTKKNIKELHGVVKKLEQFRGVEFLWKSNSEKDVGVIAQEIQKIYPELVVRNKEGRLTVKYPQLSAIAIQASKELAQENQNMKKELIEIKNYLCARDGQFCVVPSDK